MSLSFNPVAVGRRGVSGGTTEPPIGATFSPGADTPHGKSQLHISLVGSGNYQLVTCWCAWQCLVASMRSTRTLVHTSMYAAPIS